MSQSLTVTPWLCRMLTPKSSPVLTMTSSSMVTPDAVTSTLYGMFRPFRTAPLPSTSTQPPGSKCQPGPLDTWLGTLSSFFRIFAGTPLFVGSGNPHRCGAFEQLAGVGVGFGDGEADGDALGVPVNVGAGDGATAGCRAPWRVISRVPPTTSAATAATAARDTPTLAARLMPSPPIRCGDIAGPPSCPVSTLGASCPTSGRPSACRPPAAAAPG